MKLSRLIRHLLTPTCHVKRAFPAATLRAIEQTIGACESAHVGELRFVIEGSLDGAPLWRDQSARDRAIDLFSQLRIWDTEHNSGVLIYVLLADRSVEIVADRGIHACCGSQAWSAICRGMEAKFADGEFHAGSLQGIAAIGDLLAEHFPTREVNFNELSDAPTVL
ncbi:MAG: TPM domain-containing protein [Curvibacter lanceolatus]|uniref:TPM domain-containing protein n=1 Tax=Curvibacter lanceolatus TaxID=86182 RepID=UPI000A040B60|nr:TPM domain-containing protein [Curvibacter lanceolatus]MBV5295480.1 TPM domain-containing protein [Curvibacter lanceolatus]